jgi:hypothetical protein
MGLRDASPTQGRDNRVMYNRGGARVVMVCQFRTGSCVDHASVVLDKGNHLRLLLPRLAMRDPMAGCGMLLYAF